MFAYGLFSGCLKLRPLGLLEVTAERRDLLHKQVTALLLTLKRLPVRVDRSGHAAGSAVSVNTNPSSRYGHLMRGAMSEAAERFEPLAHLTKTAPA